MSLRNLDPATLRGVKNLLHTSVDDARCSLKSHMPAGIVNERIVRAFTAEAERLGPNYKTKAQMGRGWLKRNAKKP